RPGGLLSSIPPPRRRAEAHVVRHPRKGHRVKPWLWSAAALVFLAAPANAAHWTVDYGKSKLGFTVPWSGEPFVATFKAWKADIDFDPKDLAHAHALVTIDLTSESSDSPDNDDGLKGAQGIDTSKFPTATFEAKSFTQ